MTEQSRFAVPANGLSHGRKIIRSRLDKEPAVRRLEVDLMKREVSVNHDQGARGAVAKALGELGLGAELKERRYRRRREATPVARARARERWASRG